MALPLQSTHSSITDTSVRQTPLKSDTRCLSLPIVSHNTRCDVINLVSKALLPSLWVS